MIQSRYAKLWIWASNLNIVLEEFEVNRAVGLVYKIV